MTQHKEIITKKYIASGVVQGVGFRYFVRSQASRLGLSGAVRNLTNGTVEVIANGDDNQHYLLKSRLQKGPAYSNVQHLSVETLEYIPFRGFHITF